MKKLKMLASILLTLVLCLNFLLPTLANAADGDNGNYSSAYDNFTITLEKAVAGHTYDLYKIFDADLKQEESTVDGKVVTTKTLSNIKWSSALRGNEPALLGKINEIDAFKNATDYEGNVTGCTSAEMVAEVLSKNYESDLIIDFSKKIGDYILENGIRRVGQTTVNEENGTLTENTFTEVETGYYLIVDRSLETTMVDDSYSRYMVDVVANTEITIKSIHPTLDKVVLENRLKDVDEKEFDDRNTATIGENVKFQLDSSVPNMTGYTSFTYTITDVLAKGFTFNRSSLVVKIDDEELSIINKGETAPAGKDYYVEVETKNETDGTTTVTLAFKGFINLKEKENKPVVVTYDAELNENAYQDGTTGNENKAYLTYSNNPNYGKDGEVATTTEEKTYTYAIKLGLTKVSNTDIDVGNEVQRKALGGATFDVYGSKVNEEDSTKMVKDPTNKISDITSSEEGAVMLDKALGEGTYYLTETAAPSGYNMLKGDIKLVVSAEYDKTTNKVTWKAVVSPASDVDKATVYEVEGDPVFGIRVSLENELYIDLYIGNNSGFVLPSTGGIGTVIFTVVGLLVMATAAVFAVKSNKESK